MRRSKDNESFNLRSFVGRKKKKKTGRRTSTSTWLLLLVILMVAFGVAFGKSLITPSVSALFILGDSSVDCGDNTFFYPFIRQNLSFYPCDGSQTRLLPNLLEFASDVSYNANSLGDTLLLMGAAEKMGLPEIPSFYNQNGTIEGLLSGLNFGSSPATIMNPGSMGHQSLNQQLRQAFETIQMLQLQLGQDRAREVIKSSIFYLSFGKDDYIELFLPDFSSVRRKYGRQGFAHILVNQMIRVVKDLYNANVRKIICMGIGPLGCAPRTLWESYNSTAAAGGGDCVDDINEHVIKYNTMLSRDLMDLNLELPDAQIIFCDLYKGMMEIISNPFRYGFQDVKSACCGLGRYGGMVGCLSKEMACEEASTHVWWDFYNPTQAVNSLLADFAWLDQPLVDICLPISISKLASMSA
ncbi:hypothetical protein HHK36_019504 [Tetracentron sinense]|uniref:Uncharacterized protein n=1 Tax=Tetracentron sinense TaxID=13715 RepID=A0A834Z1E6_TETSI|nr:hypothetical protein HHK36_019504 [Tetracentron sinense]